MDDPQVLLRWFFLGLIYLFFFRVLQATWSGSTTRVAIQKVEKGSASVEAAPVEAVKSKKVAKPVENNKPKNAPISKLAIVEPSKLAGTEFELNSELTIGRASKCSIVLSDGFISQLHARVQRKEGSVYLEDLGSTNGTYLNRSKVTGASVVKVGDVVQVGDVVLEIQ